MGEAIVANPVGRNTTVHRWRWWAFVLDVALTLWVARAAFASAMIGFLVLFLAPQAQDLFADWIEGARPWSLLFFTRAAEFLFLLFVVWAMPLHYSARFLLDRDARYQNGWKRGGSTSGAIEGIEIWVPRLLGLSAFAVVLVGLTRALANVPDSGDSNLRLAAQQQMWVMVAATLACAVLFYRFVEVRRRKGGRIARFGRHLDRLVRPVSSRILAALPLGGEGAAGRGVSIGVVLLTIVFAVSAWVVAVGAEMAASRAPRALAIPLIFGAWLPVLTLASHYGRKYYVPFITLAVAASALLTVIIGDNHTVRRISVAPLPGLTFDKAVELWRKANDCSDEPQRCPRPLVIAAAGGASRAGFYTASVIGHLMDVTSPAGRPDATLVRNRLFAISGVSGGSVGAAFAVTALATQDGRTAPPCKWLHPLPPKDDLWFGTTVYGWRDCLEMLLAGDFLTPVAIGLSFHDLLRFGWWQDRAALLEKTWERRFEAIIDHKSLFAGSSADGGPCAGLGCPFTRLAPSDERWLPLLALNGTSMSTGRRIVTTLLCPDREARDGAPCLRDGTVQTRLFDEAYHFHALLGDDRPPDAEWPWYQRLWAYGQRWFLADYWAHLTAGKQFNDIRLSTAALNSARFPVVSPPGAIRNTEQQVVDRIVDGGYFENFGALTALELARALRAKGLRPFVLVISNDPETLADLPADIEADWPKVSGLAHAEEMDGRWFGGITGPLDAFANTRNARGTLAMAQLRAEMRTLLNEDGRSHVAHVRVRPEVDGERTKALSMSWWLSQPVQARLHEQIECRENAQALSDVLREVFARETGLAGKSCRPQ
ncbi:hypothetical protein QNA08_05185 [Chelatococcus sp. SYSU_G07232]|uniref:PNPLA domain-containing protein n=1 Tax=Chelatococcus albus TaxID=3047466 RepID=A0ABT7AE30_9HYPH|nr:hypothetical protein [Chelatococcus sp. SYSU_G07232]MDJ1157625.1 hypothetical protein [Chelatococcus sp. SYSU_G07232]